MSEAPNILINRHTVALGLPDHTNDVAAYFAEVDRITKRFSDAVVNRATDRLLEVAGRKWPTLSAIREALVEAEEAAVATAASRPKTKQYPWEVQAQQAADWAEDWMRQNPLADKARAEGWSHQLKGYVRSYARNTLARNDRLPSARAYTPADDEVKHFRGRRAA